MAMEEKPYPMEPTDPAERTRSLAEARAEIEAGHFTSDEEVAAWLLELAAGRHAPPPCDR